MARAEIFAGACGFTTNVEARMEGKVCNLQIESDCAAIRRLAEQIPQVEPFKEISRRGEGPLILSQGYKYCSHTACPVPSGIIKAVEVAAGLNLPVDASIKVSSD
jgi:hypothetical protein